MSHWNNKQTCWWCGSSDLSREHKYKKTDVDSLYGNSFFQNDKLALVKYRTDNHALFIQGPDSELLKFKRSLCMKCNNSRSKQIDEAYAKVIDFYINNENLLKEKQVIDFADIFGNKWRENKVNFYKYCVKHIGCRLVDADISPSRNMIKFLDDSEPLKDIKLVFQLKYYFIGEPGDETPLLYTGPLNCFEQKHLFIGKKITCAASWYTIKQFSINYLFKLGILSSNVEMFSTPILILDPIRFNDLEGKSFEHPDNYAKYGKMVEYMEYYPFVGESRDVLHLKYLTEYKN